MREFAKSFYCSSAWRTVRAYVFARDVGLCVRCGAPGEIVHHRVHLTPGNISDPEIALDEKNLELLCRDCHAMVHAAQPPAAEGLTFDTDGNLVKRNLL